MSTHLTGVSVGDRIELVHCADPHTWLKPGMQGRVRLIDSLGTLHVDWDDGSRLGLIPSQDAFKKVSPESAP